MDDDGGAAWYEGAMLAREEALEAKFGPAFPTNMVIEPEDISWQMTIPGFAFLRYAPDQSRPYWLWLTHGLSQPSDQEDMPIENSDLTGFGMEFAVATAEDEAWPIKILEAISAYVVGGSRPVLPLDRLPSSDLMYDEPGGHLLAMENPGYDTLVQTRRGNFHLIHLVGVTASEIAHAKRYPGAVGSRVLECALHRFGVECVTDRSRTSITRRPDFDLAWRDCGGDSEAEPPPRKKWFWHR